MKRDELIKMLTENFTADEEVTFLVNDSEYDSIEEEQAEVTVFEEKREKGHWECEYNGKIYFASTWMGLNAAMSLTLCGQDYINQKRKWIVDDVINYKKKVLAVGNR